MWYPITSQQATPIAPPKATPTCCTSLYRCNVCLDFRRVLLICRKSRHVSATLTNKLQHMLLWMVGRRIGSTVIRSRKTKIVCVRVYFWRRFHRFWETLAQTRAMILTWIQEESWEQLLLQISNSVSTLCGYDRIKNVWAWLWVGQWAQPGGMWLDITPYTHSIFLSWDITCNPCQYNTVLIQSLMHLSDSLIPAGQVQIARTIFLLVVWIPAV